MVAASEADLHPIAPLGLSNIKGVCCHINVALLLIAHCGLPLNQSANIGLEETMQLLRCGQMQDLHECYQFLRSRFNIEAEELGDPVIALRKLLDTNHSLLCGGILQTTLLKTIANETLCSKELKPSRMPNPLPVSVSGKSLDALFRSKILAEEQVQNYKWPGDDFPATEASTIRRRRIVQMPEILMVHLQPLKRSAKDTNCPALPRNLTVGTMSAEHYELTGAILHISRCANHGDDDDEEGGHTAVIIRWTQDDESCFYLMDDLDVHMLKEKQIEPLMQGQPYPFAEPDERAFSSAVLLVYQKTTY